MQASVGAWGTQVTPCARRVQLQGQVWRFEMYRAQWDSPQSPHEADSRWIPTRRVGWQLFRVYLLLLPTLAPEQFEETMVGFGAGGADGG